MIDRRVMAFVLAAALGACGGGIETPKLKKSASASDIASVCVSVSEKNLDGTLAMLDLAKKTAQEKKSFKGDRKKGHSLLIKVSKEIQSTTQNKCCREIKDDAGKFNRDQRTLSYNNLVRSFFDLTPNEIDRANKYMDHARSDLTFDKSALVVKAQTDMNSCFARVEKDVEAKYSRQMNELMR